MVLLEPYKRCVAKANPGVEVKVQIGQLPKAHRRFGCQYPGFPDNSRLFTAMNAYRQLTQRQEAFASSSRTPDNQDSNLYSCQI